MFRSHSQAGQDAFIYFLLLRHGFIERGPDYKGFYVDVGCAHPVTRSNTFSFYQRGWTGICIDANPDGRDRFVEKRPDDTFVNCGVSNAEGSLPFHIFQNPELNSFDAGRKLNDTYLRTIEVPIRPLRDILADVDRDIDFMSIDVEHYELQAVEGMDFARHRPKVVVIEAISAIGKIFDSPVTRHMQGQGYDLVAHTGHDSFFVRKAGARAA